MHARIIKIGNSQGVRIPKALLAEAGLSGDVDMTVRDGALVISPVGRPREGWAEASREMAARGDDTLLDGEVTTSAASDAESWEWT